jgi:hypothetical protein
VPRPVPPVVVASNEAVAAQLPRALIAYVAIVGSVDHATGGLTGLGGDVRFMWGARAILGVRVGARASPDTPSAHGSIRQQELVAGVAGAFALVPRASPLGAEILARVDAVELQLSGVAATGAQASSGAALGVVASAGLGGWLRLGGPMRLIAEVTLGTPLRGVTASDTGQTTTGLTGAVVGAALGVGAAL